MPGSAPSLQYRESSERQAERKSEVAQTVLIASTLRYLISGPPRNQPTNDGQDDDGYDLVCIARALLPLTDLSLSPQPARCRSLLGRDTLKVPSRSNV